MTGYSARNVKVPIGGHVYRLRVLSDEQQFSDPDGYGPRLGISSAQWSQFGQVWPSGLLLAQAMHRYKIANKRILELRCGIGLASLVLQRRGADVIASDMHPLTEAFLAYNATLNALPAVHYHRLRWNVPQPALGHFELIIASDVLHERDQPLLLAGVIERHASPAAEVMVTDPGHSHSTEFSRLLAAQGFDLTEKRCPMNDNDTVPYRGRLLHYIRAKRCTSA
ncbi:class I SAM-dependent methyltransferase [Dyella agri]|uniref:Methyltransferase domain-containing protein n=1 Tax=Dyella agri TaxID=1926869 RepID=A0ABW8KKU6_9GAMM